MTKLGEEIKQAMVDAQWGAAGDTTGIMAEAAASIAKKYIEKALIFGEHLGRIKSNHENYDDLTINRSEWLKENGITE